MSIHKPFCTEYSQCQISVNSIPKVMPFVLRSAHLRFLLDISVKHDRTNQYIYLCARYLRLTSASISVISLLPPSPTMHMYTSQRIYIPERCYKRHDGNAVTERQRACNGTRTANEATRQVFSERKRRSRDSKD